MNHTVEKWPAQGFEPMFLTSMTDKEFLLLHKTVNCQLHITHSASVIWWGLGGGVFTHDFIQVLHHTVCNV